VSHAPHPLLTFGEHGLDRRTTFVNLACARLWNVPPRAVHTETKSACGIALSPNEDCDAPRKCSAEALAVLADWSRKKAPFTLE